MPDYREACRRDVHALWDKYGIWTLLQSIADVIDADTDILEKVKPGPEVPFKRTMTDLIRKAADSSPIE